MELLSVRAADSQRGFAWATEPKLADRCLAADCYDTHHLVCDFIFRLEDILPLTKVIPEGRPVMPQPSKAKTNGGDNDPEQAAPAGGERSNEGLANSDQGCERRWNSLIFQRMEFHRIDLRRITR